ncbi:MAG: hypothetical protein CL565_07015 [Alphaproteobacteria bacterium]|nr:hypothetical protein [Alphaproteobacteria bacterium]|tara:strand:- start:196 stop:1380 length:1185 start_codon:yes stop_codon:yes gene_type:complete
MSDTIAALQEFHEGNLGDFSAARHKALTQIKALIKLDASAHSDQVAKDYISMDQKEPLQAVRHTILHPALDLFDTQLQTAMDALLKDVTLYDLLNVEKIERHINITDGDAAAGQRSAALDSQYILYSLDTPLLVGMARKNFPVPPEILEEVTDEKINRMLSYGFAVWRDICLSRIESALIVKADTPKTVCIDGGEPQQMPRPSKIEVWGKITDETNKFTYINEKVSKSWPSNDQSGGFFNIQLPAQKEKQTVPMPENTTVGFVEGFTVGLHESILELQQSHFNLFLGKTKNYMTEMNLSTYWADLVKSTASNAFDNLRYQSMLLLNSGKAHGEGTSFEDGQKAAKKWILQQIETLSLSGSLSEDKRALTALNKLSAFWQSQLTESTGITLAEPA